MSSRVPTVTVEGVPEPLPGGLTVLDVREDVEWVHGHIDGAVHIPMAQVPQREGEVPEGRLLVVCKIGGRSAQVVQWLTAHGRDAVNLEGGMLDWQQAGRPMVSDTGDPPHVV